MNYNTQELISNSKSNSIIGDTLQTHNSTNSKDWQNEKNLYIKRIHELEKEIINLKNSNTEILKLLQNNQNNIIPSQIPISFSSTYSFQDIKTKINAKTDSSSSGQTNLTSQITHSQLKGNTLNPKTGKMLENATSKRSSDESEIQNFKKKLANNRKTKSYGAINLNELISKDILGESKKTQNTQSTNINLFSSTMTQKKQDSDPLKAIINNNMLNMTSHLQMSKIYKDAKGQKGSSNKKYFLSNIDETVFATTSSLTDKDKLNKKVGFNSKDNTNINSSSTYTQTFANIGNTAQLVSSLLSSNAYSITKNIKKSVNTGNKTKATSSNAIINIDIINNPSSAKPSPAEDNKNKVLPKNNIKSTNQEYEVPQCNLTTIKNDEENISLSLSMSSFNKNLLGKTPIQQKESIINTDLSKSQSINKKFISTQNNKIILPNTTLNTNNSSNHNILENSSNSNQTNKTQETVINLAQGKSTANNMTNNSLRDSIKSLQFNVSFNSNSPKSNPFIVYKHHLDSVRAVSFINNNNYLISAGDDMCINIWTLSKNKEIIKEIKEPILSLRGHNNPIYRLESSGNSFFSSGIDGIVKQWKLPEENKLQSANNCNCLNYDPDIINFEVTSWQASNDMIWSLKCYGDNLLSTASSDGYIKIWKIPSPSNDNYKEKKCKLNILLTYSLYLQY